MAESVPSAPWPPHAHAASREPSRLPACLPGLAAAVPKCLLQVI
jgi:hypothetical protein